MLNVHVRVNDAATGKPTPVRLRLVAGGQYRPPLGRLADFATEPGCDVGEQVRLDGKQYALIDGTCEVPLSPGDVSVEIYKGPEYLPIVQNVPLAAGRMALRFTVQRWTDLREKGWYAGDIRAHEMSPHSALLEGAAEGLAVVQLLVRERRPAAEVPAAIRHISAFSGTTAAVASPDCLVAVNTFNVHSTLGRVSLLNGHRVIYPLVSGAPGPDDWSVADWCEQCHRKKGLVVWVPSEPRTLVSGLPAPSEPRRLVSGSSAWGPLPSPGDERRPLTDVRGSDGIDGEALACLILGNVDAFETDLRDDSLALYYRLVDCGFRPALVGGSGKESNAAALGSVRTYARLPEGTPMSTETWIEAVRAGRTFVTAGPLLEFTAAGRDPGAAVRMEPGRSVRLRAEGSSAAPLGRVEIVAGGEVVAAHSTQLDLEWTPPCSTWVAARCIGTDGRVAAHTSPVWLDVPGRPCTPESGAAGPLLRRLEAALHWVETQARVPSPRQVGQYLDVIETAYGELLGRVGRAAT